MIIYSIVALLIIVFALLSICLKNIFHSLLSAIMVFFLAGVVFYILGSEYNAVVQILIYGLAVPVILALAIMFTNQPSKLRVKDSKSKYIIFLTSGIFIMALIYLVLTSFVITPNGFNIVESLPINSHGVISAISEGLFSRYVLAFEIVSLILTIIVAGICLLEGEANE